MNKYIFQGFALLVVRNNDDSLTQTCKAANIEVSVFLYVEMYSNILKRSLLAEALFLLFADGRKETSAMGRKWLY